MVTRGTGAPVEGPSDLSLHPVELTQGRRGPRPLTRRRPGRRRPPLTVDAYEGLLDVVVIPSGGGPPETHVTDTLPARLAVIEPTDLVPRPPGVRQVGHTQERRESSTDEQVTDGRSDRQAESQTD